MDSQIPYADYLVVLLPAYENPPAWMGLGFNIRGGEASQPGIFICKVIPDSDARQAGLQDADRVLAMDNVHLQATEHSKAVEILKTAREISWKAKYYPINISITLLTKL
uniref:PDZ domain-containing protein n=1 Tax=Oryctolagus cuniculus TaxID=9986 RepID=A0A5F9DA14_RABIT